MVVVVVKWRAGDLDIDGPSDAPDNYPPLNPEPEPLGYGLSPGGRQAYSTSASCLAGASHKDNAALQTLPTGLVCSLAVSSSWKLIHAYLAWMVSM
jgi:hypothetical protein